ncbi:TadE/TadG family type IV pilus assembly protein, partial [Micromonospora zhanjiangensis]
RRRAVAAVRRLGAPAERDRGASPVELAILLPTILVLLIISIQAAAYYLARALALNAAQIAVTESRTYRGGTAADGEAAARQFVANAPRWLVLTSVEVDKPADGGQVTATVRGTALTLLPGVTIEVRQSASGPVERFVPED